MEVVEEEKLVYIRNELSPGLTFAMKHKLSPEQMRVLLKFLEKPYNTKDLAPELGLKQGTLHHLIMRLKLKGMIRLKERDDKGNNTYEFNEEVLEG